MRRLRLGIKLRRAPRPWSDAEERRLATAHKKGRPDAVIALQLDRPARAVKDRRHLLGLVAGQSRGWSLYEDARLRTLYRSGEGDHEICQELGRTSRAVGSRRRLDLVQPLRGRWTENDDVQLPEPIHTALP